jgi:hypothetical protein
VHFSWTISWNDFVFSVLQHLLLPAQIHIGQSESASISTKNGERNKERVEISKAHHQGIGIGELRICQVLSKVFFLEKKCLAKGRRH